MECMCFPTNTVGNKSIHFMWIFPNLLTTRSRQRSIGALNANGSMLIGKQNDK